MTPEPPWCAVEIHPALALYPAAAEWLGDFERCVAWAWVDPPWCNHADCLSRLHYPEEPCIVASTCCDNFKNIMVLSAERSPLRAFNACMECGNEAEIRFCPACGSPIVLGLFQR